MSESHRTASHDHVESLIRSAASYVQPSAELRPRTVEAARQAFGDQHSEQKFVGFAVAILVLAFLSSPAIAYVDLLQARTSVLTAEDMEHQAIEYAARPEIGTHWGFTEAFTELRRAQANRLGMSFRSIE